MHSASKRTKGKYLYIFPQIKPWSTSSKYFFKCNEAISVKYYSTELKLFPFLVKDKIKDA